MAPREPRSSRPELRAMTLPEIEGLMETWGEPRYRARQVWRWLNGHRPGIADVEEMSDVPVALRRRLREQCALPTLGIDAVRRAADGTRKLRLRLGDARVVESVIIPEGEQVTLCVSSQAGCALDCSFCATATLGFGRQMSAGEILDQVVRARAVLDPGERVTNLVFMGMGEPLHNYAAVTRALALLMDGDGHGISPRRITVSTAGLVPAIERYGREPRRANLAISLNATTDEVRDRVMPINRRWNLGALLDAARRYPLEPRRRLTFEYVLLAGVNDADDDAGRLPRLLSGLRCKVNLIPFNPHPGAPFARPAPERVARFQEIVRASGLAAFVRTPRGDDIDAACGQLAARQAAPGPALPAVAGA